MHVGSWVRVSGSDDRLSQLEKRASDHIYPLGPLKPHFLFSFVVIGNGSKPPKTEKRNVWTPPLSGEGYRVIRSNRGTMDNGITVALKDGNMQFELRGADPPIMKFTATKFETQKDYSVTITYDHVEKKATLYLDKEMVEMIPIITSTRVKVRDGQIGCWDDYDHLRFL